MDEIIWYGTPLHLMPLTVRALNALDKHGYEFWGQVQKDFPDQILALRGIGYHTLIEIGEMLDRVRPISGGSKD
jgi:hypothetical protein